MSLFASASMSAETASHLLNLVTGARLTTAKDRKHYRRCAETQSAPLAVGLMLQSHQSHNQLLATERALRIRARQ